ncbi:MAG: DNA-processing protein DprA [Acidimicrobiia bacterium]
MRSPDSLATVLLSARLSGDDVAPLKASEYWMLRSVVATPGALLGATVSSLVASYGLDEVLSTRVARLVDRGTAMAFELERLDSSGVSVLTPFDEHAPRRLVERLGHRAPPLLYCAGAVALLDGPGIAVVGSRDSSEVALAVARSAGEHVAAMGRTLVTGFTSGLEHAAVNAALTSQGSAVVMLAEPLRRTLRQPDVRRSVYSGHFALCTPYGPDVSFTNANATGRSKLIYAQSQLTLVVSCLKASGITWSGAVEAIVQRTGRVAVWRGHGEGPGNERLQVEVGLAMSSFDDLDAMLSVPELAPAPAPAPAFEPPAAPSPLFD